MRVGDYVRNKYGIAKVVDIEKGKDILNGIDFDVLVFDNNICFLADKKTGERKEDTPLFNKLPITKDIDLNKIRSSSDITDLIELGDVIIIINGMRNEEMILIKDIKKQKPILKSHTIKSIVTKEQFESMEYKVN